MKKAVVILCFVVMCLLCGCSRNKPEPTAAPSKIVTQIHVFYDNGSIHTSRLYNSSEKMRAILNYLRWIDPYGIPSEDPDTVDGSLFRIEVEFSDGSRKVYLQKADRFMQIEGQPWKYINPENAMTLGDMLGKMESDSILQIGSRMP